MDAERGAAPEGVMEAEVEAVAILLAMQAYEQGLRETGHQPRWRAEIVWKWLLDEDREHHRSSARVLLDAAAVARRAADLGAALESMADLRNCLYRLKTECEIEGLDRHAGFDAWIAWANRLLDALDAPVSRPGRLASEDARAEATRLPEQPSQGFGHQSRGQVVPFALASEGKSDAVAQKANRRAADPGAGVVAVEVERLTRERDEARQDRHELTKAITNLTCGGSEFFVRRGDDYVADIPRCLEWVRRTKEGAIRGRIDAIKAQKVAEDKLAAAEARAEAAERERDSARTALRPLLGSYCDLANSGDAGFWDPEQEPEVIAARAALAAQIGGTAREGAATCQDPLQVGAAADTTPDAEGGHGIR